MLWLDRQHPKEPRYRELRQPIHAAKATEPLERRQHQTLQRTGSSRARALRWPQSLRATRISQIRIVLVRATTHRRARRFLAAAVSCRQEGLGLLSIPGSLVSQDRDLVGRKRKERRDEAKAAGHADRALGTWSTHTAADASATPVGDAVCAKARPIMIEYFSHRHPAPALLRRWRGGRY